MFSTALRAAIDGPSIARLAAQNQRMSENEGLDTTSVLLELLDAQWQQAISRVPHYAEQVRSGHAPSTIDSLSSYLQLPELSKAALRRAVGASGIRGNHSWSTGGSTAEPVLLPADRSERVIRGREVDVARNWWGLTRRDPKVLFWGHSHAFGTGYRRAIRVKKRRVADALTRTRRVNAYDRSVESFQRFLDSADANRRYWLGYSGFIAALARYATSQTAIHQRFAIAPTSGICICTAESLGRDDQASIFRAFGCTAVSEYGAAEVGLIAHAHTDAPSALRVMLPNKTVEVTPEGDVLVTNLANPLFPIIRYRTGDVVDPSSCQFIGESPFVSSLGPIQGRSHEVVQLRTQAGDTVKFSAIGMTHILLGVTGILGMQFVQHDDSSVTIRLHGSPREPADSLKRFFLRQVLRNEGIQLDPTSIRVETVAELALTLAGKRQTVIKD